MVFLTVSLKLAVLIVYKDIFNEYLVLWGILYTLQLFNRVDKALAIKNLPP